MHSPFPAPAPQAPVPPGRILGILEAYLLYLLGFPVLM